MGSRLDSRSNEVKKAIKSHRFDDEDGDEYEPSKFGGFNDYFRRKKIKLQNRDAELRSSAANNPPIFKNVVVHVNGYTQPSLNDLHHLVVSYAGGFVQYLDGKTMVTHIIASNLTPKKKVEFARYRIVRPAWIVDSVEAGRLLPWDSYRLVDEGAGQRVLNLQNGHVSTQVHTTIDGYRDQTDTSWYTKQVKDIANQIDSGISGKSMVRSPGFEGASVIFRPQIDEIGQERFEGRDPDALPKDVDAGGQENGNRAEDYETPYENVTDVNPFSAESRTFFPNPVPRDILANDVDDADFDSQTDQALTNHSVAPELQRSEQSESNARETIEQDEGEEDLSYDPAMLEPCGPSDRYTTPDEPTSKGGSTYAANDVSAQVAEMTSEEHNALLLSDPKVWKSTVVNPGFLKQYYEESRLHHLSTWKAALKSQLQKLAAEKTSSQNAREKRAPGTRRYILHVDFDSFFAAVSLRKHPQYIEKPVVVAHGDGSGAEIASCNYPARKYGIKNGMWMKHAQKMCPHLKVLPYDFKAYEDASRKFYEAIMNTGGLVQSVSVDEALLDVSDQVNAAGGHDGQGVHEGSIWREQTKADDIAQGLRRQIRDSTGCEVSVGIGGNILLAKIALRKAKPAGQYQLRPEDALDIVGELTMQDLPGIAWSIGGRLEEIGVKYVKDVRQLSKERMMTVLGPKTGEKIWDYSRGIDRAEVGEQVIRKSVSAEVNWGIRFVTQTQVDEFIYCLAEELHQRLINESVKGRQLTMKIMRRASDAPLDPPKHLGHGKCDTFSKSLALGVATNDSSMIGREALSLLKSYGFSPGELRGLGIQMQKLEPLKTSAQGPSDSSQKTLQFKKPVSRPFKPAYRDESPDDIQSPPKAGHQTSHQSLMFAGGTSGARDRSGVPLNTSGTQFHLPSQVDRSVLEEIPMDVRKKLFASGTLNETEPKPVKGSPEASASQEKVEPTIVRDKESQLLLPGSQPDALISHSQIDQETLQALPQEVQDEVLAQYGRSRKARDQAVLPQSPRKDRMIRLPKKITTPTKRRGRPIGGGGLRAVALSHSTLTQSNFVANQKAAATRQAVDAHESELQNGEISTEFLSALPEDIRTEVMAQARRDRLQKKAGLDLAAKRKRPAPAKSLPTGQRTLTLVPRPPKPSFTAKELTSLPDLRETMTAWHDEFNADGPFDDDVVALADYLKKVVVDEGDMDKAINVVKWLKWIIANTNGQPSEAWIGAAERMEEAVQNGLQARGLGGIEF